MGYLLNVGKDPKIDILELNEDYIICFCAQDDKLSQWRGYAPEGGVSIGFDFHTAVPFYVLEKDEDVTKRNSPTGYRTKYVQIGRVCYLRPRKDEEGDEYYQDCAGTIGCPVGLTDISEKNAKECREFIGKHASYIKHAGFCEEDESRLVFRNVKGYFSECVRYKEAGKDGSRQPYIVVCAGNPEYNRKESVVRICIKADQIETQRILNCLRAKLGSTAVDDCRCTTTQNDKTDSFCFGCTRRRWKGTSVTEPCRHQRATTGAQWGLHKDENSIIISQGNNQESVFEIVHETVREMGLQIPIWCEGHLPIRSITIGPCIHQKEVEESIRHYCRHTYWLRDVKIKSSNIPFRQPG